MPDQPATITVRAILRSAQRDLRVRSVSDAVVAGAAAASIALTIALVTSASVSVIVASVAGSGMVVTAISAAPAWRRWTFARVARFVEQQTPLDNLLITAEETLSSDTVHPILRQELFQQAASRLEATSWRALTSPRLHVVRALAVAMAAMLTSIVLLNGDNAPSRVAHQATRVHDDGRPSPLVVIVSPPAYTRLPLQKIENPSQLQVLAGSKVTFSLADTAASADVVETGSPPIAFVRRDDALVFEDVFGESRVLLIRARRGTQALDDRMVQIRVEPDRGPVVRIRQPARDLLFAEPRGSIAIELDATDDVGVEQIGLRYTTVSGSGEGLTFAEGELPLQVQAANDRQWSGRGSISLDALKLAVGDTVVYRAIARDRRPGADPASSESFLIEIGRLATATSGGFAIPEEHDRQGLSQQMLIVKTERLYAARRSMSAADVTEQSRLLAVEQRMVRAEFVFMTGGEVEDEVAEAEHGHELVEGRFENEAQMELLNAIREMSRAEARLNASDTTQALVYERAALRALQRAFDRRRYLLRTLPERARIDLTRRLTGDLKNARSSSRPIEPRPADPSIAVIRQLMVDVAQAADTQSGLDATLASRLVTVDPASTALQTQAMALATGDVESRINAARQLQQSLLGLLQARLGTAAAGRIVRDPFAGHVADQLVKPEGRQ